MIIDCTAHSFHALIIAVNSHSRPRFLPVTIAELGKLRESKEHIDGTMQGIKKLVELRDFIFEEDKAELQSRGFVLHEEKDDEDGKSLVPTLMDVAKPSVFFTSPRWQTESMGGDELLLTLSDVRKIKEK